MRSRCRGHVDVWVWRRCSWRLIQVVLINVVRQTWRIGVWRQVGINVCRAWSLVWVGHKTGVVLWRRYIEIGVVLVICRSRERIRSHVRVVVLVDAVKTWVLAVYIKWESIFWNNQRRKRVIGMIWSRGISGMVGLSEVFWLVWCRIGVDRWSGISLVCFSRPHNRAQTWEPFWSSDWPFEWGAADFNRWSLWCWEVINSRATLIARRNHSSVKEGNELKWKLKQKKK